MAHKKKNSTIEKKQIKITLEKQTLENLETACAFAGIQKSEYIEKILQKKFKKISDETNRADMKKIMKV